MLLFVALTVFYSCTADEDLLDGAVSQNGTEKLNTINKEPPTTSSSDSIPANQTDTTAVADKPSTVPVAVATPSSGVSPLEVTFSVSSSLVSKTFAKYQWKFKDGTKTSSAQARHTFKEIGKHEVELTVTDDEGQVLTDSVTVTVNALENKAPVAAATANILTGDAPLAIDFTGSGSTDDSGIKGYFWDFRDGSSSNETDPSHAFLEPGTYQVELTVTDEKDLTDKATVTITVAEPANEAPIAAASASVLSGGAPLQVDFVGGESSDDNGIASYYWDIPGSPSSDTNETHTFSDPGVYDVTLTVTDEEGLTDTAALTITVDQGSTGNPGGGNLPCSTGSGTSIESGSKVWCWQGINVPSSNGSFYNKELTVNSHCSSNMVTKSGDRVYFKVNPKTPSAPTSCSDFNYRAEIRDHPSDVKHTVGTEQWWGYDYRFGNDYLRDELPWIMFQIHGVAPSPLMTLQVSSTNFGGNTNARGEILVKNGTTGTNVFTPTGVVPNAGQTLKIVIYVKYGDEATGVYKVWIDGVLVYNNQERTVYASKPWGGYWKMGIYKWKWKDASNVNSSEGRGINEINTSIGTLRTIMRRPGDSDYGKDSYSLVAPD